MTDPRRRIPAVDALLESEAFGALLARRPRERVVSALRRAQTRVREAVAAGGGDEGDGSAAVPGDVARPGFWAGLAQEILEAEDRPSLRPVINATGVVLHTNLGRAPLAAAARRAMTRVASGYSNLEMDLETGERGSRYVHCVGLLRELTGAEDALVVNNGAAALVLAVNTLGRGRGVAVSRGELVEIGGGFRIPEMLERAGARLVEVGSTNRTRLADYRVAVETDAPGSGIAVLLKVHRSNFRVTGFTEEATLEEVVELGRERGLPVVHDLGSGLLADPTALGLPPEPRARESIDAGADLVLVSGDKLLGGPQAGIVVGRADRVAALRANPLCRALRVDKVTLAALEATLALYREPERAHEEIPALRLLGRTGPVLERAAERVASAARAVGWEARVVPSAGTPGGGTYPGVELPGHAVALTPPEGAAAHDLARRLRSGEPPVVGRVEEGRLLLDLRTVQDAEVEILLHRLAEVREGWGDGG